MKEFWLEFFKFLKELAAPVATFFLGKKVGEIGKEELRSKRDALKLEIERFKIQERIRLDNAGKSDSDIIDGVLRRKVPGSNGAKEDE